MPQRPSSLQYYDDLTPDSRSESQSQGPSSLQFYDDAPQEPEDTSFGSGYALPSLRDIGVTALKIPTQLGQMGMGLLDLASTPQRKIAELAGYEIPDATGMLHDLTGYDAKKTLDYISEFESPELKQARQEEAGKDFVGTFNSKWRNPGTSILSIEESLPAMAAGMGVSRAALGAAPTLGALRAGMLGEFLTTAGQQAADIRDEKGSDITLGDVPYAAGSAALTAGISGAGGKLANKLNLPDVEQMLADPTRKGSRRILPLLGTAFNEGVLEEAPQSYQEKVATNLATGKPWNQGAGQAAASGMISGGIMGGGMPMVMGNHAKPTPDRYAGTNETDEVYDEDTEALGATFEVPEADVTGDLIKAMRDNGFVQAGQRPGGKTVFRRVNSPDEGGETIQPATSAVNEDLPLNQEVQPTNDISLQYNAPPPIDQARMDAWDEKNPYTRPLNIPVEHLTPETRSDLETAGYVLINQDANISIWRHNTDPSVPAPAPTQEPYVPDDAQAHEEMWRNLPDPVGERTAEGQAAAGVGPDLVPTNDVGGLRVQNGIDNIQQTPDQIDLASRKDSYDWERDDRATPGVDPAEVNEIFARLGLQGQVRDPSGNPVAIPPAPAERPQITQGGPELLPHEDAMIHPGETVEFATADGGTFWVDKIADPARIRELNAQIAAGQLDIIQKAGGINPKNVTPTRTGMEPYRPPVQSGEIVAADPTQYGPKGEGFLRRTLRANPNLSPADIAQMHDFLVSLDDPNRVNTDVDEDANIIEGSVVPDAPVAETTPAKQTVVIRKGQLTPQMLGNLNRSGYVEVGKTSDGSSRFEKEAVSGPSVSIVPPTADDIQRRVDAFDKQNQPDLAYKSITASSPRARLKKGQTWKSRAEAEVARLRAEEASTAPKQTPPENDNVELRHPTAIAWMARVKELDAAGAPDSAYRDIASTLARKTLKKGDTWRAEIMGAIEYFESRVPPDSGVSSMARPSAEEVRAASAASIAERIKDIITRMDEAQRRGDIREVTRLGSELQEIEDANRTRGAEELYDRGLRGKEGRWWESTGSLGPTVADMHDPSKSLAGEDTNDNFLSQMTGNTPDDFVRMEVGERTAILRNMQGSYAEHGARVANKELLQNAIDATPTGGTIDVDIDFKGKHITVTDQGLGLPIDLIKNEFVTLTGSGKRGVASTTGRKTIGEMGVGKATYLLGTDSFEVTTVAKEPDGSIWEYTFRGDADTMIGETADGTPVPPMKINKRQMPPGTPTGTTMRVYDADVQNLEAAREYLKTFAEYSDSPVTVNIKTNQHDPQLNQWAHNYYDINKSVTPRTATMGQHIASGSLTGGDYSMHVPTNANWSDQTHAIAVILTARGMFQGVDQVHPGTFGVRVPDRIVLNIEPTVSAQDGKNYPLTSPTREKLKGPFKQSIQAEVKKNLVDKIKDKAKADVKAAYDALVPGLDPNTGRKLPFVTNDRGGRYTVGEMYKFNGNPSVQGIARHIEGMMNDLNRLFSGPRQQLTKTVKFGWDLANLGAGGINIQDVANPAENAVLIGLFDALDQAGGDAKIAAELIAHTVLHEFNHNRARTEGADFTYKLRDTDARFGTDRRGVYAKAIEQLISDGRGGFNQGIRELIQQHTAARGRPDTKIDFIARQEQGGFLAAPGSNYVPKNNRRSGEEATSSGVSNISYSDVKQATGWGMGGQMPPPPPVVPGQPTQKPVHWVKEALAVPAGLTTTADISAPWRQGLGQIHTPQFWKAVVPMLKAGFSEQVFNTIDADLRNKPVMLARRHRTTGKVMPSIATEAGLKMFESASSNAPMGQRAQATASRWIEQGIGTGIGSRIWKNTAGVPIRASNRAYITFLNHLKVNRFEYLMDQSAKMHIEARNTGFARPGFFKQAYTAQEAKDLNGYRNKVLAKELADFVNTATGQGPLKTHVLPFRQTEVSLESAAGALQHLFFSPGLIASRVRMLNPSTYIMASPQVRMQYLQSALATGAAWMAALALIKGGGGDEVEVNLENMTSADWAKAKIGDTRMDPGGGFQQFLVAMARMIQGGTTSSASNDWREFGEGFNAPTQKGNIERFLSNKFNPVTKFAYDLASQSEYNPFHVKDRVAQLFVPLVIQDLIGLYYENPKMLPWMVPIMLGMGTQTYGRGESVGKLVAPENDWLATGGGLRDVVTTEDENF